MLPSFSSYLFGREPELHIPVQVEDLPEEMITEIFRYLNTHELHSVVPHVCTKWKRIAKSLSLLRVLTFQGDDGIGTDVACSMLVTCSANLRELNVLDRKDAIALLHAASQNNKSLQSLNIRASRLYVKLGLLKLMVKCCPDIQSISVEDTLGDYNDYFKELSLLHNLKKLTLGSTNQALKENLASSDADVEHLCSTWPRLTELTLVATKWTDAAVLSIITLTSLEVLGIRFGLGVTSASLIEIPRLENLRSLDFSFISNDVTPGTWISMFSQPTLMQLKVLRFTCCPNISDGVLDVIGANCQQLERIRFASCMQFTEIGFEQIITKCNKLVEINVSCTKYRISTCYGLIPVHLPDLRVLEVGAMPLSVTVLERLKSLQSSLAALTVQYNFRL